MLRGGEDKTAARTAQRLVGGAGHELGDTDRRRVDVGGDETRIVRHVHHQQRPYRIGHGAKALPVDDTRIGGSAGNDELGLVLMSERLGRVVIDEYPKTVSRTFFKEHKINYAE